MSKATTKHLDDATPLLVRYAKPKALVERNHWYDEQLGLNVTTCDGEVKPVILLPNSAANLKTKTQTGGED